MSLDRGLNLDHHFMSVRKSRKTEKNMANGRPQEAVWPE